VLRHNAIQALLLTVNRHGEVWGSVGLRSLAQSGLRGPMSDDDAEHAVQGLFQETVAASFILSLYDQFNRLGRRWRRND
jgi:hypothetical protein